MLYLALSDFTEDAEEDEAGPVLEDHLPAPPGTFMGVSPGFSLVEHQSQVSVSNYIRHLTNSGPLHGTGTNTEYETDTETEDANRPMECQSQREERKEPPGDPSACRELASMAA